MILGYFVMVFPVIAILSAIIYLPIYVFNNYHKNKQSFVRQMIIYMFIGCCMSLIYLTILWYYPDITFHPQSYFLNIKPFIWVSEHYDMGIRKMLQQLVLNIAMFVPYGILLPIIFRNLRKILRHSLVIIISTVTIESIQFFMGRSADVDDIIMNAVGGICGYVLWIFLDKIFKSKKLWRQIIGQEQVLL